jgi:hypothetical protein
MTRHARRQLFFATYLAGGLALLPLCGAHAGRQGHPTVVIKVRVSREDAPVRILGFRLPGGPGHVPLIHLRNVSSAGTASVSIERVIHIRPTGIVRPEQDIFWGVKRAIPPGAEIWAGQSDLASDRLLMDARELRSSCLLVDVSVMEVNFADGTTWTVNRHPHLYPQDAQGAGSCTDATASGNEMEQIMGFTVVANSAPYSSDVQSYSVTCSLESKGEGEVFATCPF